MESTELVWDVSPDFLMRWSPQHRLLTVYPLVSTLLTNDTDCMSSRSIGELAYRPTIVALQDAYTCTQVTTLDITPLLCFMTGQFFPSGFPLPNDYPPDTYSLLTPRTLSPAQCELILRISRQWKSSIPHHIRDRSAYDIAKRLVDAWYADPEPPISTGYLPPTTRTRSHQRVNGSMIHLRPLSLDSSEASFAGLIPFFISLLHVQRPTAVDERRMTQPPSFLYWLRFHLGCPWSAYRGHPAEGNQIDCPSITSPTRTHIMCARSSFHVRSDSRSGMFTEFHIPLAPIKLRIPLSDLPYPTYQSPSSLASSSRLRATSAERHRSPLGGRLLTEEEEATRGDSPPITMKRPRQVSQSPTPQTDQTEDRRREEVKEDEVKYESP